MLPPARLNLKDVRAVKAEATYCSVGHCHCPKCEGKLRPGREEGVVRATRKAEKSRGEQRSRAEKAEERERGSVRWAGNDCEREREGNCEREREALPLCFSVK